MCKTWHFRLCRHICYCKGDNDTARQSEKAVGTLGRVVRLERQTDLHDAPAQQDQAHRTDEAEDEGALWCNRYLQKAEQALPAMCFSGSSEDLPALLHG